MSFRSESDMRSKELQNSDSINVDLMTYVFKIIVKHGRKIISKYRHLLLSGNRALTPYISLKRDDFVRQENSKPSVFTKLVIGRKNTKIFQ